MSAVVPAGTPIALPELEQTVTELILELLLIERENRYPELLYAHPDQKQSVRITMHYTMALLAYGFTAQDEELKRALSWFDKPFPRRQDDWVNVNEMNRLTVLLHLAPHKEQVQTRLRYLAKQQANGYFDIQPGWQAYDSLWALEAFVLAKKQGVLSEQLFPMEELRKRLSEILAPHELKRDKDRTLALRMWFDLYGELEPEHVYMLHDVLEFAGRNHSMWGMREFEWRMAMMQLKWFQALVEGRRLTYDMVRDDQRGEEDREDNYKFFRKVILSTCMVIEYL
ncbi:MAG TPA: hypothetical protein VHL11_02880, partial [Phototrophicaceae bacterium]|nr:hypothetical protein [Phototrophicaceae bacterium]